MIMGKGKILLNLSSFCLVTISKGLRFISKTKTKSDIPNIHVNEYDTMKALSFDFDSHHDGSPFTRYITITRKHIILISKDS